ncbi:hypothetical protein [Nocardia rosealba]|uniref:hypothetical protein n=1 Tax=Nocardia rosealba TaxID=2878563 RepID=UPI001CD919C9|nr:hypothetical protein [Nocardia rosealba]MCA2206637.1 hypothetical protein [Nocardia rosealba]
MPALTATRTTPVRTEIRDVGAFCALRRLPSSQGRRHVLTTVRPRHAAKRKRPVHRRGTCYGVVGRGSTMIRLIFQIRRNGIAPIGQLFSAAIGVRLGIGVVFPRTRNR